MARDSRARQWVFTLNNPCDKTFTDIDMIRLLPTCKLLIYQTELGDQGTLHLQGVLIMTCRVSLKDAVKLLSGMRPNVGSRFRPIPIDIDSEDEDPLPIAIGRDESPPVGSGSDSEVF